MLVRFYHGFATAVFVPVSNAYVAELFPNRRGERISLFSSMTTIGRTAAPFLGGYILFITSYNFHQLYMVVGVAGFVAFVTGLLLLGKDPQNQARTQISTRRTGSRLVQGWLTVAKNPRILATSLIEASQYYAFGATEFFLVGYLKEVARFDPVTIGVVTGSQIAVIPILKPLMGRLSDKVGRTAPIVFGSLISALSLAAIPFILKFILLLLISMSFGIGFSMVTSSTPALISELTDENLMGTGMGFLGTIMDLGQTLGPIITGFILAAGFGYVGSFLALTMVLLVTCTVFSLAEFSARRESEHA